MTLAVQDEVNREFRRTVLGALARLGLLLHEARHADGFPHNGACCAGPTCDVNYDESNLTAYGVNYWFDRALADGTLNTGYSCWSSDLSSEFQSQFLGHANLLATNQFCEVKPPLLDDQNTPMPPCSDCAPPAGGIIGDRPVAVDDAATVESGSSVIISVLDNDQGLADTPIMVSISSTPNHGMAFAGADNRVTYTSNIGFSGDDSFQYTAADRDGDGSSATVTVNVRAAPPPPPPKKKGGGAIDFHILMLLLLLAASRMLPASTSRSL